jgi:hypothetical protein
MWTRTAFGRHRAYAGLQNRPTQQTQMRAPVYKTGQKTQTQTLPPGRRSDSWPPRHEGTKKTRRSCSRRGRAGRPACAVHGRQALPAASFVATTHAVDRIPEVHATWHGHTWRRCRLLRLPPKTENQSYAHRHLAWNCHQLSRLARELELAGRAPSWPCSRRIVAPLPAAICTTALCATDARRCTRICL